MANGREHLYDARAFAVHGMLTHPLHHEIKHTAHSKLGQDGGYAHERSEKYRAEGVVSYECARSHVAGNPYQKGSHAWSTLSTSVIEHFNVMDVVTADRIVAQIHTYHPAVGFVPQVTFLGTRFENLCIAGHLVNVDLHLDQLGPKPAGDIGYLSDAGFLGRVAAQRKQIYATGTPPADVATRYPLKPTPPPFPSSIETSLVYSAGGKYPGTNFGHVIVVPDFGKIYLATLRVSESDPAPGKVNVPIKTRLTLKMIEFEMGSIIDGNGSAAVAVNNGNTTPP
jgi:hypothetical protein